MHRINGINIPIQFLQSKRCPLLHRLEFLDLQGFINVAELGTFHEAAQRLHLSQSALSRRIQKLEGALGIVLFERTTRHVRLTAIGSDFLPRAKRIIEDYESSVLEIRGLSTQQKGTLTIACLATAASYFLPSVISEFNEARPGIRIRILETNAKEGLERVISGEADFGINMIGMQHLQVSFQPLLQDPFVLAIRSDHPLAAKKEIVWSDLEHVRLITLPRGSSNRVLLDNALSAERVNLNSFYEIQHLFTSLRLVESGLGAAIVPRMTMPSPNHKILCWRQLPTPRVQRSIGLVRRNDRDLSSSAELFMDMLLTQKDIGLWQ